MPRCQPWRGERTTCSTNATANVFIFFRPGQDFSRLTLKELAAVQKELAGKSIRWVGIVSDRAAKDDVQAMVKESGISMPVLIDVGDVFYGKLGVAQEPVTVLFDQQHKLVAYQSFTKVNYAAVVTARVRYLLKEISDEELAAVLNPPAALTDSDEAAARRRLKLATMLFQAKSYPKALENVDASIAENPSAAAYALRGDILAAQGNCPEAAIGLRPGAEARSAKRPRPAGDERLPGAESHSWPAGRAADLPNRAGLLQSEVAQTRSTERALNSAVECHLHTVEVVGSNPTAPTTPVPGRVVRVCERGGLEPMSSTTRDRVWASKESIGGPNSANIHSRMKHLACR